jgi:hypothetical protein
MHELVWQLLEFDGRDGTCHSATRNAAVAIM